MEKEVISYDTVGNYGRMCPEHPMLMKRSGQIGHLFVVVVEGNMMVQGARAGISVPQSNTPF